MTNATPPAPHDEALRQKIADAYEQIANLRDLAPSGYQGKINILHELITEYEDALTTTPASHDATTLDTTGIRGRWRNGADWDSMGGVIAQAHEDIDVLLAHIDTLAASLTAQTARVEALERERAKDGGRTDICEVCDGIGWLRESYMDMRGKECEHCKGTGFEPATQPSAPRSETPAPAPAVAPTTTRLTARNSKVLKQIKQMFNKAIYRDAVKFANDGSIDVAIDYIALFDSRAANALRLAATDARTDGGV